MTPESAARQHAHPHDMGTWLHGPAFTDDVRWCTQCNYTEHRNVATGVGLKETEEERAWADVDDAEDYYDYD